MSLRNMALQDAILDLPKDWKRPNYWPCQKNRSLYFFMSKLVETRRKELSFVVRSDQKVENFALVPLAKDIDNMGLVGQIHESN